MAGRFSTGIEAAVGIFIALAVNFAHMRPQLGQ